jgi:hypothetical protein
MRVFFNMPLWAFCLALLLLFYGAMGLGTALGRTVPAAMPHAAAATLSDRAALPIEPAGLDGLR